MQEQRKSLFAKRSSMRIKVGLAAFCLLTSFSIRAQINVCGTDIMNQQYGQAHPERIAYQEQMRELIRHAAYLEIGAERNTIVIPTVVHVMHKGGAENITNEQVLDGIRVLNEDLRRINSDTGNTRALFKPYGADFNIEFRLAKLDPSGNCTNGITYTYSSLTDAADDNIKRTSQGGLDAWPVNKYFNIWVVGRIQIAQDNVIGYAYFPSWGISSNYGVVINNHYFGTIGSAAGRDGRTLTHEVGHCLELYHTFQDGCGSNCSNSGDDVCDTPPVITASYACSFSLNTCSNDQVGPSPYTFDVPDMVENYMSYNQDGCQNIFTKGQKVRSDAVLQNTFLSQLITPQNLTATGTTDGFVNACTLVPDFNWDKAVICIGDSVLFSDFTHNGTPTSRQWTFTGPQTLGSTALNPTVIFTQAGLYTVTLSVTNAAGTQAVTKQNIVRVTDTAASSTQFFDGFDNQPITSNRWYVRNAPIGNGWEQKTTSNGNATVYVNNLPNNGDGTLYELYSPSYDISSINESKLRFKTAYAQRDASSADRFRMYVSNDCGATWVLRFSKTGSMMASLPAGSIAAEPNSPSDWLSWESNIPAFMQNSTHLMIKFTFEAGLGNNFYLDDLNISGLASIEESMSINAVRVYPNPTANEFTIDLSSLTGSAQVFLYDMSGRLVYNTWTVGGNPSYTISAQSIGLAAGMYRISVKGKSDILSGKVMITE